MMRDQLVTIVQNVVSGNRRVLQDGSVEHKLPAVVAPEKFDPPAWVLEAMQRAYDLGYAAGTSDESFAYSVMAVMP